VVGDLPVAHSHGVDRFELNGLAGGGDAEKFAAVRPVVDLEGGDDVAVDGLPIKAVAGQLRDWRRNVADAAALRPRGA
jgi:hypothetical protein